MQQFDINFVKELLLELPPRETGLYLRDLGFKLKPTLEIVEQACKELNVVRYVFGTSELDFGFDPDLISISFKLEIVFINDFAFVSLRESCGDIVDQLKLSIDDCKLSFFKENCNEQIFASQCKIFE